MCTYSLGGGKKGPGFSGSENAACGRVGVRWDQNNQTTRGIVAMKSLVNKFHPEIERFIEWSDVPRADGSTDGTERESILSFGCVDG